MNIRRALVVAPALVLALSGLAACGSDDGADSPGAGSESSSESTESEADEPAGTLELVADGSMAGKCAVPTAETLAGFDTAFSGTVTALDGGVATLAVDQWYAGEEAATVTVEAPSAELGDLLMAVDFEEGSSYLVSAQDGRVTLCGFSAEKTPELEGLYVAAFGQ